MDYNVIIIGAGVIGLSVANSLAKMGFKSVLIIDKNRTYGLGISSRNSEVIHSGIYYPSKSNKAKYCSIGRDLLYSFCKENNIWHKKIGKIIVANENQDEDIQNLFKNGKKNNIPDIEIVGEENIKQMEPYVKAKLGLHIGCTGIVDSHGLMNVLYNKSIKSDHDYLFMSSVIDSKKIKKGYSISIVNSLGEKENVTSFWVVNCAGLNSDVIANQLAYENKKPIISFSKGCYFKISSKWKNRFNRLIYPLPDKKNDALGIHLSFDKNGYARLGPSAHWLNTKEEDYNVDDGLTDLFFHAATRYINGLDKNDIYPDFAGIRPKLKMHNGNSDFYISHEKDNGYPGYINLIGIDSPGLTSSIAIGNDIASLIA